MKTTAPKPAPKTNVVASTAAPAPSAAPGTQDAAAKKEKKPNKRIPHPALWDATTQARVQLDAIPTDFDAKLHKPLGKKDFKNEGLWYELKAQGFDKKAAEFRAMAATAGTSEGAKTKKLILMQKKMAELMASLKSAGVDVDAALALANQS